MGKRNRCLDPQKRKLGHAEARQALHLAAARNQGYRGLHVYKCSDHWHIGHYGIRGKGKFNRKKRGAWK